MISQKPSKITMNSSCLCKNRLPRHICLYPCQSFKGSFTRVTQLILIPETYQEAPLCCDSSHYFTATGSSIKTWTPIHLSQQYSSSLQLPRGLVTESKHFSLHDRTPPVTLTGRGGCKEKASELFPSPFQRKHAQSLQAHEHFGLQS